jgi:hypothetical protein
MALKSITAALALTAGLALAAGAALAHEGHQGPPPKTPGGKAAWARHDNFKAQGAAFKAILDELKKDPPDQAVLTTTSLRRPRRRCPAGSRRAAARSLA